MALPEPAIYPIDEPAPAGPVRRLRFIPTRALFMRRLLLTVTALNLAGMALLWASLQSGTMQQAPDDIVPSGRYLMESVGFAMMLPGIFFASFTLLFSRLFGWNEGTTCAVWYFSAGFINVLLARSTSDGHQWSRSK